MSTKRYLLSLTLTVAAMAAPSLQPAEDALFAQFRLEQRDVVAGRETGAQALEHLLRTTEARSHSPAEFIKLTQALFVHNSWIPTLPGTPTPAIPPTRLAQYSVNLYTGLPTNGWKKQYKDMTDGKPNNDDQSHHLVAFLSLGYYRGPEASALASYYHKLEEGQWQNQGDIQLGIVAARYGDELRHDKSQAALYRTVDHLCQELFTSTQTPTPMTWSIPSQK